MIKRYNDNCIQVYKLAWLVEIASSGESLYDIIISNEGSTFDVETNLTLNEAKRSIETVANTLDALLDRGKLQ